MSDMQDTSRPAPGAICMRCDRDAQFSVHLPGWGADMCAEHAMDTMNRYSEGLRAKLHAVEAALVDTIDELLQPVTVVGEP